MAPAFLVSFVLRKMVGGRGGGFRVLLLSEFQGEKGQGCWALSTVLLRVDAVGRKG